MFCTECGHIINDNEAEFCVGCGVRFSQATKETNKKFLPVEGESMVCHNCGVPLIKNDSFCRSCGCKKAAAQPASIAEETQASHEAPHEHEASVPQQQQSYQNTEPLHYNHTQNQPQISTLLQRENPQVQNVLDSISGYLDGRWVLVAGSLAGGSALLYFILHTMVFNHWWTALQIIASLALTIMVFTIAKKQIDLTVTPLALTTFIRIISVLSFRTGLGFIYLLIFGAMLAIFLLTLSDRGDLSRQVRVVAGFSLPVLYFIIALFNIISLVSALHMFATITFLGSVSILNYIAAYSRDFDSLAKIDTNNLPNASVNVSPQSGHSPPPPTEASAHIWNTQQQQHTQQDEQSQSAPVPEYMPTPVPAPVSTPTYQASPDASSQNINLSNNLISTVQIKGNGESAYFYDDHLKYNGQTIRYSDIATMDTHGVVTSGYALIIFWGDFNGRVHLSLKNGQKFKIRIYGFSLWGMGTKKSAERRYSPLFNSVYKIVAHAMAQKVLAQIEQGETITISGIEINKHQATGKKFFSGPAYISKQNFGKCWLDGYHVRITDREGRKLYKTSDNSPNALLLPYVLNTLLR